MKLKTILAALIAVVTFASCNDSQNEYHSTYFYPNDNAGILTYADQSVDSIHVFSYDSWKLTNNCEWFDIYCDKKKAPLAIDIPVGYMGYHRLDIYLQPNTTGKVRGERISVVSSFDKIGTISQYITQFPHLNITKPAVKITNEGNTSTFSFETTVEASGKLSNNKEANISFIVYTNSAELSSDQPWLTFSKYTEFKKDIENTVNLLVEPNTTGKERFANIQLTSNGISTFIRVKQNA